MDRKRTNGRYIKTPQAQPFEKVKNIKIMVGWIAVVIIALGVAYYYFIRAESRTHHYRTLSSSLYCIFIMMR